MLKTYPQPPTNESNVVVPSELLTARGDMLANCGRYLQRVGLALDQAEKKAMTTKREALAPNERITILELSLIHI